VRKKKKDNERGQGKTHGQESVLNMMNAPKPKQLLKEEKATSSRRKVFYETTKTQEKR